MQIPATLSGVVQLASDALTELSRDDRYRAFSPYYHYLVRTKAGQECRICLAGALLAEAFDRPLRTIHYTEWGDDLALLKAVRAVEAVRKGDLLTAQTVLTGAVGPGATLGGEIEFHSNLEWRTEAEPLLSERIDILRRLEGS